MRIHLKFGFASAAASAASHTELSSARRHLSLCKPMVICLDGKMEAHSSRRIPKIYGRIMEALRKEIRRLRGVQRYNIQTFRRQPWQEISGSFGDLGTLLPIMIALANNKSISLLSTLVFGGLANVFTGLFFGIPLPVQPMKAIAAVALRQRFNEAETISAGIFVAAVIGFFSFTGLLQWFTKKIPIPVIKGIQMGTGLSLVTYSGTLLQTPLGWFDYQFWSLAIAIIAFLALLWTPSSTKVPYALIILLSGIVGSFLWRPFGYRDGLPSLGIWRPHVVIPLPSEFSTGTLQAGLGQVPLTTLNSVVAVTFLAADILPNVQAPLVTSMGLSVMAMNLVGCWFGSMPVCHGSGGLAAQYRFGARSGASIIFLGLLKLLLGLFAGDFTTRILSGFPIGLLAVMVVAAGLELANVGESLNSASVRDLRVCKDDDSDVEAGGNRSSDRIMKDLTDEEKKRRWSVMLITVGGILAFRNDAVGFLAGMLCHWSFKLQDGWELRRSQAEGQIRLEDERQGEGSRILPQE